MTLKNMPYRKWASILVWASAIVFSVLLFNYSPTYEDEIDWLSALSEGAMALMPAIGLAVINNVEHTKVHRFLFMGLTLLLIALITDTLDEFVLVPPIMTHICEGGFQVLGFLILLCGLREWALDNQKITAQLHHQASTDPLTGISNRRMFLDELNSEINRLKRFPSPLSLILFDLDFFKQVNDTYGHGFGDSLLKKVADDVSQHIREIDLFARFGGEEFIIAAKQTDLAEAQVLAQKIQDVMHKINLGEVQGVNASFGISHFHPEDTVETLLKRADDALYHAKASGRDAIRLDSGRT